MAQVPVLVVTRPFGAYVRGQVISDPATVADIRAGDYARCTVATTHTVPDAPVAAVTAPPATTAPVAPAAPAPVPPAVAAPVPPTA